MRLLVPLLILLMARLMVCAATVDYLTEVKPVFLKNCTQCHGEFQQKGGLRLDTALTALKGGQSGQVIIPKNANGSVLIQVLEGRHRHLPAMPYKKSPLLKPELTKLKSWINAGAKYPANEKSQTDKHWAFVPPVRSVLPTLKYPAFARNPIDHFIQAKIESLKLKPSPEADKHTLIRRLNLDLTGLPPSIEEVDRFVNDKNPGAYERAVDALLASPHYGERWGRWWLDAARYADSNGYSIDAPRSIWKYRDWVITALNDDMPFDRFTVEQLAGDMLPDATLEQKIATGFHRNTQINQEGGIDREQFRIDSIFDRVASTGTVFLGLTIGCAQCHDHKFDPIKQSEYYKMFAFFNNADEPDLPVASDQDIAKGKEIDEKVAAYQVDLAARDLQFREKTKSWERELTPSQRQGQPEPVRQVIDVPFDKRSEDQWRIMQSAYIEQSPANKLHQDEIKKLRAKKPKIPMTMVVRERPKPRETHLFIKGDFTRKADQVFPGTPAVLHPFPPTAATNRLTLARWLTSTNNPITARVMMNRVWQQYFGRGIVETENDFGTQGALPTHPELLDWLAMEFMERGWSLKAMHRLIVTSSVYRQQSAARNDVNVADPYNRLLARQNRLRLDAELIRDVALSVSGLISKKIGGPSVHPPQPDGVMSVGQVRRVWATDEGEDRYRRGLYTFYFRATPYPALSVFDAPDSLSSCTRRIRSNTPLQALTLLNDPAYFEISESLAKRVIRFGPKDDLGKIQFAFRLCLSRPPSENEQFILKGLLDSRQGKQIDAVQEQAKWTSVARTLLNLDETITRE